MTNIFFFDEIMAKVSSKLWFKKPKSTNPRNSITRKHGRHEEKHTEAHQNRTTQSVIKRNLKSNWWGGRPVTHR